jgi:hypothetical protein
MLKMLPSEQVSTSILKINNLTLKTFQPPTNATDETDHTQHETNYQ